MIREGKKAVFTDKDRENLSVRKYTDEEVKNNLKEFNRDHNKRRIPLLIVLRIMLLIAIFMKSIAFAADIGIVLVCGAIILSEILHRLNRKRIKSRYYIEIIVERKREVETFYETSATTGPESFKYYPVEGRDSMTNYRCICYISKEQYENAVAGQRIRINVGERI